MKSPYCFMLFLCFLIFAGTGCQEIGSGIDGGLSTDSDYTVTLTFNGPVYSSWKYVYAAWIEDEEGNNLQNLYICNGILDLGPSLYGDAIPYWLTKKYDKDHPENYPTVDGVTGASIQGTKIITSELDIGEETRFKVCFEIDRSCNGNDSFIDRPAFTYKSELIDLGFLDPPYELELDGFMANDSEISDPNHSYYKYNQTLKNGVTFPEFEEFKYMASPVYDNYINDDDGDGDVTNDYDDLVTSLIVQITEN